MHCKEYDTVPVKMCLIFHHKYWTQRNTVTNEPKKLRNLISNEIKDLILKIERGECVKIKRRVEVHNMNEEVGSTSK